MQIGVEISQQERPKPLNIPLAITSIGGYVLLREVCLKVIIEIDQLYNLIARLEPERRGIFITETLLKIIQGARPSWITDIPKTRTKAAVGDYTADFESFWKEYPKKDNKLGAYIQWKKIKNPFSALNECLEALKWQTIKWSMDNNKFCPLAENYILKQRWLDEPPQETIAKARGGGVVGEWYTDMNGISRQRM
jgi:hypothetical protein